ncbi:MAG TPA: hypothetical protein VGP79_12640 [Bryobacteraceae bacterium]|jgi:hypothetical protein|nr:hypothetical protein [Bryobacteraceae bacterium]
MFRKISAKVLALPLVAMGMLSLTQPAAAQSWQRISNASGGFTVQMPGSPREYSKPTETRVGTCMMHTTLVEASGGREVFMISYGDYPSAANLRGAEEVIAAARDGQVNSVEGRLISDRAVSIDGRPGRSIVGTTKDNMLFASRIFLDGHRLYQVIYVNQDGQMPQSATEFLNSFRITR